MRISRRLSLLSFVGATAAAGTAWARGATTCRPADGRADDLARAAARQADMAAHPPRIAPLPQEQIPDAVRTGMAGIYTGLGLQPATTFSEFHATLAKSPELMLAHLALAVYLFRGKLPVRDRELAILRVAWITKAPFEWGEHVKVFKRLASGTPEEVERLRQGSSAPGWSEHERAVVKGVEELFADAMISDPTWAVLAKTWTEPQLLEFPVLVGKYVSVAFLQNSIRTRREPDNPGLAAA
jgi:alkylhydroperoxidase family enzyme